MAVAENRPVSEETSRIKLSHTDLVDGVGYFIELTKDQVDPQRRIVDALTLVDRFRGITGDSLNPADIEGVQSTTLIDALEWHAWRAFWHTTKRASREEKQGRRMEYAARLRLQNDVGLLHAFNRGNEQQAYDELTGNFWLARMAVKAPPPGLTRQKSHDFIDVNQQLNYYKTLNALQAGGYERVRMRGEAIDRGWFDMEVPLDRRGDYVIRLKLQPGTPAMGLTTDKAGDCLQINIPIIKSENPFVMDTNDQQALIRGVDEMRQRVLAPFYGIGVREVIQHAA